MANRLDKKLKSLSVIADKISFVLDRAPMFNVPSDRSRKKHHQVKALEIIWKRFPNHFGPRKFPAQ